MRLRFADPELERAFVASHGRANRGVARIVAPIVTVAWAGAIAIDPWLAGSAANAIAFLPARLISLGVLVAATAFIWRASAESFERRFERVLLAAVVAVCGCLVGWSDPDIVGATFNLVVGNVIGWFAGYNVERYRRQVFVERGRSERLIRNVLPEAIAERLKGDERRIAEHFPEATVLFADLVGFTPLAERLTPAQLVSALDDIFSEFDDIADRHGLEKIKTIGDAYMVVGGVPAPRADHARAIVAMALEMRAAIATRTVADGTRLALRIGIHTGPVVAGVIGKRKFIYDLWGDTVNLASRMESHGVEGGIQITEATRLHLGDAFRFEERAVTVKGKGAPLRAYLLDHKL
jgi:class 3 adenylate cyclase